MYHDRGFQCSLSLVLCLRPCVWKLSPVSEHGHLTHEYSLWRDQHFIHTEHAFSNKQSTLPEYMYTIFTENTPDKIISSKAHL